jgi:hypothetical protein
VVGRALRRAGTTSRRHWRPCDKNSSRRWTGCRICALGWLQ